jgi:hypothetical protein
MELVRESRVESRAYPTKEFKRNFEANFDTSSRDDGNLILGSQGFEKVGRLEGVDKVNSDHKGYEGQQTKKK